MLFPVKILFRCIFHLQPGSSGLTLGKNCLRKAISQSAGKTRAQLACSWPLEHPPSFSQHWWHTIINLNFEKSILIFHRWWLWLFFFFFTANVLIQCFLLWTKTMINTGIKNCFMYLFLSLINQSSFNESKTKTK